MKKLILGIGIPASGKSFFLEDFGQQYCYPYICTDNVRAEFDIARDNPLASTDNSHTFAVWDEIRRRTIQSLKENETVIVDATFAKLELRNEFISLGRENYARVIGVFFNTPAEIAWQRNLLREFPVPEQVFKERVAMLKQHPPTSNEFDSLLIVNTWFPKTTLDTHAIYELIQDLY